MNCDFSFLSPPSAACGFSLLLPSPAFLSLPVLSFVSHQCFSSEWTVGVFYPYSLTHNALHSPIYKYLSLFPAFSLVTAHQQALLDHMPS